MKQALITIVVDLDVFPGVFHYKEDAAKQVEAILKHTIGHYRPTLVSVEEK